MLITRTITKKVLETIIHETFSTFGNISSSSLLDSLKYLGFYYATNAGISINIEDLKTPNVKRQFLETANDEMSLVSKQWEQGFVSDTERFQTIIDSWNIATESLKNRIIDYYQNFDPANNLYIMAFSGARGNMSQVRQLVGMRGLMSDQEGRIIDLPIQTNFREGLSSIDYIISSYGARKGIVDTALKTADSGYLTRRLIFLSQDLIIRDLDCKTERGILFFLNKKTTVTTIIGKILLKVENHHKHDISHLFSISEPLNANTIEELKNFGSLVLTLRSPLTCDSNGSICQKCYGWDLAQYQLISLGEAVGIIAAQSIGEPGTQLTMRTFHTGGIFTSELVQQTVAPFSGKLILPKDIQKLIFRTNHGVSVLKLQRDTILTLINWQGIETKIPLYIGASLYITTSGFVKKSQLIAEYSSRSIIQGSRRLKPIYTPYSGEIRFENLVVLSKERGDDKPIIKVNQDDGILWIGSGKIFELPYESHFVFPSVLNRKKAISKLKLVTPYKGYIILDDNKIEIVNNNGKIYLELDNIIESITNCEIKPSIFIKNYQYIDEHTIFGTIYYFPKYKGKVYAIREKDADFHTTFFLITESDIWKLHSDHLKHFSISSEGQKITRSDGEFHSAAKFSKSGFLLKKQGFKYIFQTAHPIFLSPGTILKFKQGDFSFAEETLATLVNSTQQTEDIVQGLPKVEELIEARVPKLKSTLAPNPGLLFHFQKSPFKLHENSGSYSFYKTSNEIQLSVLNISETNFGNHEKNRANILFEKSKSSSKKNISKSKKSLKKKKPKDSLFLWTGLYPNSDSIVYKGCLWSIHPVPNHFNPKRKKSKDEYFFIDKDDRELRFDNSRTSRAWRKHKPAETEYSIYCMDKTFNIFPWEKVSSSEDIFINNKTGNEIIKTIENGWIYLSRLFPYQEFTIIPGTQLPISSGSFVDIGEALSEGMIDPHQLLSILFHYHQRFNGILEGTLISLTKFQLILVNSIQGIYQSQGVNIASKHVEIVVRQMTSKVTIIEGGDTPFLGGSIISIALLKQIVLAIIDQSSKISYRYPNYEPLFQSTTNVSLDKDGFLAAAGFQETKRVLARAAIEGKSDWLRGLKECVIIGRLIPAGSAFLNYKNYLDNIYFFTDEIKTKEKNKK